MTRLLSLILFLLTAGLLPAQQEPALTLEEAVRLAVARHQDVDKARAAADALKGKIREVRAQALPDVQITADAMRMRDPSFLNSSGVDKFPAEFLAAIVPVPVNMFNYGITVKQPLFTQGKVGTALRLASVEAEGALSEIDRAEQDVAVSVVKAYYDLLWAEQYRDLVADTQEQKKKHAAMARTLRDNGVATEVDVLRSEVAVANGAPDLVRAENGIRQARAQLNYYIGRALDYPTKLAGHFEERLWEENNIDALEQEAIRRRPELERLRIAERSAETQLKLAGAENRARADFSGAYGISARRPSNLLDPLYSRWSATVSFSFPIFDGFKRSGLVYQATANQRMARLEREKAEKQIRLAVQQGFDELKAADETIAAAQANVGQAERVLSMTQDNYKYGAATTLDIVDAQTAVSVARSNMLRGLHDYSVARANLRWAVGQQPWE